MSFTYTQDHPRVTVGAFIRNSEGKFLLCQSPKWENYWVVCGGHVDLGETIAAALVREVKEEVGLDVKFLRVFNVIDFINNPHFFKHYHFIGLQCECELVGSPAVKVDQEEITATRWFSLEEALADPQVLPENQVALKILQDQYAQ